jgi:hypothetical protein
MRQLSVVSWTIISVSLCFAQNPSSAPTTRPDLSGAWVLDRTKSSAGPSREKDADLFLNILQQDPEIRITKHLRSGGLENEWTIIYYSDGRGETNTSPYDPKGLQSVTRWKGNKLVSVMKKPIDIRSIDGRLRDGKVEITEKWELSKDGSQLTQTLAATGVENVLTPPLSYDPPSSPIKRVFKRKS